MQRKEFYINQDWRFMYGTLKEAIQENYDDSNWVEIGIPHSFGIPYFMTNEFYVGEGTYRKEIVLTEPVSQQRIFLEFGAVFQTATVYLNGSIVGTHRGGYTAFCIDVTEQIHTGKNSLVVFVSNRWDPTLAPRAGEHVFNGGIYRDVKMILVNNLHVAWYGTFVRAREISKGSAILEIETEVENSEDHDCECLLTSNVIGGDGERLQAMSYVQIRAGNNMIVRQELKVTNPFLWHPDHPNLYRLNSIVSCHNIEVDTYDTEFGIRSIEFTSDRGFFLNGEHYDILGANVHQDHAGWADAVTHAGIQRDVSMIKNCGMNFIRGSHYPHHTEFAKACDEQGILFWSENCFWGTGGPKEEGYWTASAYPTNKADWEAFEQSVMQSLREMIRTNRNHPSIIAWSMCNEPFFSDATVMERVKEFLKNLVERSHRLDPSRPAAIGGAQRGGIDGIGDVTGFNGDGAVIFHDPGYPNLVSEYGSTVEDRPGTYVPRYSDHTDEQYSWRSGKAIWCAFHHGSILADMGHMGMIDYYRVPLRTWYWYRENLLGIKAPEPVAEGIPDTIRLCSDRAQMKSDGTEDAMLTCELRDALGRRVDADCEITLSVEEGGAFFPSGRQFVFSKKIGNFAEGIGAIEVRSYYAGKVVIKATSEGLYSAQMTIDVVGDRIYDGQPIQVLTPPRLMGEPKRRNRYNIGVDRPVFCSSEQIQHPARSVTEQSMESYWLPETNEPAQWVMVDLEGTKQIDHLFICFCEVATDGYAIELSDDGNVFREIYVAEKNTYQSFAEIQTKGEKARFVRAYFNNRAVGITEIMVFA